MFLVLAVIGLALLYARYGIEVAEPGAVSQEVTRVGREFRDARNHNRQEMHFGVNNLSQFLSFINELEYAVSDSLTILRKNITTNNFIYLTEIRTSIFSQFVSQIRSFESDGVKREDLYRSPDIALDLRARLAEEEQRRNRLENQLANATTVHIQRIDNELRAVQDSIAILRSEITQREHNRDNSLLFLTVSQTQSGIRNLLNFGGNFVVRFITGFFILTVVLLLLILLTNLVLRMMSALGIHTVSGKDSRNKYKYGSYKYGSNSKRKVKRIHKGKDEDKK